MDEASEDGLSKLALECVFWNNYNEFWLCSDCVRVSVNPVSTQRVILQIFFIAEADL